MLRIDNYGMTTKPKLNRLDKELVSKKKTGKSLDKKEVGKKRVEDQLSISDESRKLLEEKKAEKDREMEEKLFMVERFKEDIEAAKEAGSPYDDILKCIKIASRIMKGDKVPGKDMNYLAEHQPEMFSAAIMFRDNNEKPKSHKSLLEEPKEELILSFEEDLQEIIDLVETGKEE